jgi:hypothetical protein
MSFWAVCASSPCACISATVVLPLWCQSRSSVARISAVSFDSPLLQYLPIGPREESLSGTRRHLQPFGRKTQPEQRLHYCVTRGNLNLRLSQSMAAGQISSDWTFVVWWNYKPWSTRFTSCYGVWGKLALVKSNAVYMLS